jgi:AcrR family transcriptional regulator
MSSAGRATAGPARRSVDSPWEPAGDRARQRARKRDAVILAAARAFRERGYHNTSLDDIAAALNVTKPTIYHYVSNKEQILFECFRTGLDRIRTVFDDLRESDAPARERLISVIRRYAEAVTSEFGWCMVRAEDQDLTPVMSRRIKALKAEIDQGIRALIRAGVEDGSIRACDPKMTAFAIAGALNWMAHWYRDDASLSADEIAARFIDVFDHGLAPRPR